MPLAAFDRVRSAAATTVVATALAVTLAAGVASAAHGVGGGAPVAGAASPQPTRSARPATRPATPTARPTARPTPAPAAKPSPTAGPVTLERLTAPLQDLVVRYYQTDSSEFTAEDAAVLDGGGKATAEARRDTTALGFVRGWARDFQGPGDEVLLITYELRSPVKAAALVASFGRPTSGPSPYPLGRPYPAGARCIYDAGELQQAAATSSGSYVFIVLRIEPADSSKTPCTATDPSQLVEVLDAQYDWAATVLTGR